MIEAFARAHRAGQRAFNEGDFERAFATLAEDVEWHVLPRAFETGVLHGRDEVVRYFRSVLDGMMWSVEAQEFIDAGRGRVVIHQRGAAIGRTTGIADTLDFFQLWELGSDSQIARIREYETREEALAAANGAAVHDLVESAYEFFNREKRSFTHLWHREGEYVNSRQDPDHEVHHGIDAIQDLTQGWIETYPDLLVEPLEIRVKGDNAFVWTRWSGHAAASGVQIDMELAHCWTVADGKIRRIEEFFERDDALRALGWPE